MERRRFLVKAGGVLVAAGATTAVDAPNVIAQPKFQWRMSTTWTPALDVLQGSAQHLGKIIDDMSGGGAQNPGFSRGGPEPALRCLASGSPGPNQALFWAPFL